MPLDSDNIGSRSEATVASMGSATEGRLHAWIDRRERDRVGQEPLEISVVVPAYNEERRLPLTLVEIIDHLNAQGRSYEVIVVDDGSRDATSAVVRKFEALASSVRLIRLPSNSGKGYAVRTGVLSSRGRRVLFADADGSTPIAELARLERSIDAGADVAFGSRAKRDASTRVEAVVHRKLLGRMFNAWISALLLPGVADTQCGFKLFTRRSAMFLFGLQRSRRFSFDFEILFLARRCGLRIDEVPVNWTHMPGSKVNVVRDGLAMLRDAVRFRATHRDVSPAKYAAEVQDWIPAAGSAT